MPTRKPRTTADPTNADISLTLEIIIDQLKDIHKQTKETNGRVTKLERWKERLESDAAAIEAYKKQNPQPPVPTPQEKAEGWTVREKTLTAIITSLLAIMAALVGAGKL